MPLTDDEILTETLNKCYNELVESVRNGENFQQFDLIDQYFEPFENNGYKQIANGSSRRVYRIPSGRHDYDAECVVKIPFCGYDVSADGMVQTRVEVETWEATHHADLVPVFEHGPEYKWEVMPETPILEDESVSTRKKDKITMRLEGALDGVVSSADIDWRNIGYWDGRWRMVDFGYPTAEIAERGFEWVEDAESITSF